MRLVQALYDARGLIVKTSLTPTTDAERVAIAPAWIPPGPRATRTRTDGSPGVSRRAAGQPAPAACNHSAGLVLALDDRPDLGGRDGRQRRAAGRSSALRRAPRSRATPRSRSAKLSFTEHPGPSCTDRSTSAAVAPGTSVTASGMRSGGRRSAAQCPSSNAVGMCVRAADDVAPACVVLGGGEHAVVHAGDPMDPSRSKSRDRTEESGAHRPLNAVRSPGR